MGAAEIRDEIRRAEFAAVCEHLPSAGVVLDLGAGPGLQTELLESRGHEVVALDLPHGTYAPGPHMVWFDGVEVPVRTSSVDVVFSSHVLEHVDDLPALFDELGRVLRPGGVAVHVVPTATWRLLGMVTRWKPIGAAIVRRLRRTPAPSATSPTAQLPSDDADRRNPLVSLVVPLPHGAHHSAFGELLAFSLWGWRRTLEATGWRLDGPRAVGLAYSGTHAGPDPSMTTRRRVARLTGSSSAIWLLYPPVD